MSYGPWNGPGSPIAGLRGVQVGGMRLRVESAAVAWSDESLLALAVREAGDGDV